MRSKSFFAPCSRTSRSLFSYYQTFIYQFDHPNSRFFKFTFFDDHGSLGPSSSASLLRQASLHTISSPFYCLNRDQAIDSHLSRVEHPSVVGAKPEFPSSEPTPKPTPESVFEHNFIQSLQAQIEQVKKGKLVSSLNVLKKEYPGKTHSDCVKENARLFLALKIKPARIARVFRFNPNLFSEDGKEKVIPNLLLLTRYGLSEDQIARSIIYYPRFIVFRSERILGVLKYLRTEYPDMDLARVVSSSPGIFCIDVPELKDRISHLSDVGLVDVPKMIEKFSPILNLRHVVIQNKVQFYQNLFGRSDAIQFLKKLPQLLGFNMESVEKTYRWLQDRLGPDLAFDYILTNRGILGFSAPCLEQKFDFLCDSMNRDNEEILKYTYVLKCSFKNRLLPRYNVLKAKNLVEKHSLSYIYSCSNAIFEKRYGVKLSPIPKK